LQYDDDDDDDAAAAYDEAKNDARNDCGDEPFHFL
jgi:hypothetical protein